MALINSPYTTPPPQSIDINKLLEMMGQPITDPTTGQKLQFGRINAGQETNILDQLKNIGGMFNPARMRSSTNLQAGLTGIGGYKFVQKPDGTLEIDYNQNGQLGERQVNAVNEERWNANARGMLYSSFTDEKVGNRLSGINLEAQKTINSYFADIADINSKQSNAYSDLSGQLIGLLGEDVRYAVQNYVPPASTPSPDTGPLATSADSPNWQYAGISGPGADWTVYDGYGSAGPTQNAATITPTPQLSYSDFVKSHGGKSTSDLATAWKKRFAPWLL